MKIAFLNTDANLGGAERCLIDLMSSLRTSFEGASLSLILGAHGPLEGEARALGVVTRVLPLPRSVASLGDTGVSGVQGALALGRRALGATLEMRRYVRELAVALAALEPEVIHSNSIKFHFLAAMVRPVRPTVWHLHDFIGARPVMARVLRWSARRATFALAVSRAVCDDARRTLPTLPVEVAYNAIDTVAFAPGPGEGDWLDALAGITPAGPGALRVGLVATYGVWKGHDVFLEAAARLSRPDVRFYVVGGPIYATGAQVERSVLCEKAQSLGIAGSVGFVGFLPDVARVYRTLDVVVHASTRPEPFGRTIVEGMACGRAVVVSRAGGAAELFEEGRDAVGFEPGDAADLARAIASLLDDPARRERLGTVARETVLARFSRERLGPAVMKTYERMVSRK